MKEISMFPTVVAKMYLKLFLLANIMLTIARNIENHQFPKNHRMRGISEKLLKNVSPIKGEKSKIFDKPVNVDQMTKQLKEHESSDDFEKMSVSKNGERIEFQIQGHAGPQTYVFGFDTGHGKNRQYRFEEKSRDGIIRGKYGFYDATGKLRIIKYIASPSGGYHEKHHETIK